MAHHALINVIEPVFERRFIHHSYACRVGKGNHRALSKFVEWGRQSRYILKLDIRKFFPTIDHEILKSILARSIKDEMILWLCGRIIDRSNDQETVQQWFPGDTLLTPVERRKGIPIGNLTSQFFGNVYLDPLDHFIKERLGAKRYLRYVDDLALFGDDKPLLRYLRAKIAEYLALVRLKLNEGKSRVRRIEEGVEFLGFTCLQDRLRLSRRNVRAMRKRMRRLHHGFAGGEIAWPAVERSLEAWNAHAGMGDTWRLRGDVYRAPFTAGCMEITRISSTRNRGLLGASLVKSSSAPK